MKQTTKSWTVLQWLLSTTFLVFLFLGAQKALPQDRPQDLPQKPYDEMLDEKGQPRYTYRGFYPLWQKLSAEKRKEFLEKYSLKRFEKDNRLYPAPKILDGAKEYDEILAKGAAQRIEAIQRFLKDHYSGKKTYAKDPRFPKEVFEKLLERTGDSHFLEDYRTGKREFTGIMGFDVVRGPDGKFYVLEDNPGWIGGPGDLILANQLTRELFPELDDIYNLRNPREFYLALKERFKLEARKHGTERVVHYTVPPYPDNEDKRLKKIYADLGIVTVTPYTRMGLTVRPDGVYLIDRQKPNQLIEKVGFVVLNGEHHWLDLSNNSVIKKAIETEARAHLDEDHLSQEVRKELEFLLGQKTIDHKALMKALNQSTYLNDVPKSRLKTSAVAGLTDAIFQGKVGSSYSPGIDFVGDKEFYLYVDDLVRFYLGVEDPILRNVRTRRMSEVNLDEIYKDVRPHVIKPVDGRGGDGIIVGPFAKPEEIKANRQAVEKNPHNWIVQDFLPIAQHDGNIGDYRIIGYMGSKSGKHLIANVPWSRGLEPGGNGKVNLSDKGFEVTTLVMDGYRLKCQEVFGR